MLSIVHLRLSQKSFALHEPRGNVTSCEEELVMSPSTSEAELGSTDLRLVDQLRGGHDPE